MDELGFAWLSAGPAVVRPFLQVSYNLTSDAPTDQVSPLQPGSMAWPTLTIRQRADHLRSAPGLIPSRLGNERQIRHASPLNAPHYSPL